MSTIKRKVIQLLIKIAHDFGVAFVVTGLVVLATVDDRIPFGTTVLVLGLVLLYVTTIMSLYLILTDKKE